MANRPVRIGAGGTSCRLGLASLGEGHAGKQRPPYVPRLERVRPAVWNAGRKSGVGQFHFDRRGTSGKCREKPSTSSAMLSMPWPRRGVAGLPCWFLPARRGASSTFPGGTDGTIRRGRFASRSCSASRAGDAGPRAVIPAPGRKNRVRRAPARDDPLDGMNMKNIEFLIQM